MSRYGLSKNGWTDQEHFHGWLKEHFLTHAVPGCPLLLLVDGHSSHYDPAIIHFVKEHSFVPAPSHYARGTTTRCQFLQFSEKALCHDFCQSTPGKVITKFNFSQLFSKSWLKATTPENICSGIRKAGLLPFNPNAITAPAQTNNNIEVDCTGDECHNDM